MNIIIFNSTILSTGKTWFYQNRQDAENSLVTTDDENVYNCTINYYQAVNFYAFAMKFESTKEDKTQKINIKCRKWEYLMAQNISI